jgi:hypothetical protein
MRPSQRIGGVANKRMGEVATLLNAPTPTMIKAATA